MNMLTYNFNRLSFLEKSNVLKNFYIYWSHETYSMVCAIFTALQHLSNFQFISYLHSLWRRHDFRFWKSFNPLMVFEVDLFRQSKIACFGCRELVITIRLIWNSFWQRKRPTLSTWTEYSDWFFVRVYNCLRWVCWPTYLILF